MDKGSNGRTGKVVTCGRSTSVQGLKNFLDYLEKWPGITKIRLGSMQNNNLAGRRGGG